LDSVTVKLVETVSEMEAAKAIRIRVFVHEQDVPIEEEMDDADGDAVHALALLGSLPVGTGRLVILSSGEAQIGRMAVDRPHRRAGVGTLIMEFLEQESRRLGLAQAILHAQTYVKDFYGRQGYVEEGDLFMEAGIEHISMRKRL
jgi:predicted GNAT family N-acyltransferase